MKDYLSIIMIWLFIFPVRWLILRLPIKMALRIGRIGGFIYYIIPSVQKGNLKVRLQKLFPEKNGREIEKIIIKTYKNYIQTEMEDFLYSKISGENIEQLVEVNGLDNLEAVLKGGKGAILLHTHFGNPKMLMPALGYKGYKINQVGIKPTDVFHYLEDATGKKPHNIVFKLMQIKEENETSLPVRFIYLKDDILRQVIDCIKRNEIVAMSIDSGRGKMISINFIGQKGAFVTGPLRLALRSNAPILPLFVVRRTNGTHVVIIEPPISIDIIENKKDRIRFGIEKFAHILESYVRRYPCHYVRVLAYNGPPFNISHPEVV